MAPKQFLTGFNALRGAGAGGSGCGFLTLAGFGAAKTEAELQAELAVLWAEVDVLTARRDALSRRPTAPAWPRLKLEEQLTAVFSKIDRVNRQLAARVARKHNLKGMPPPYLGFGAFFPALTGFGAVRDARRPAARSPAAVLRVWAVNELRRIATRWRAKGYDNDAISFELLADWILNGDIALAMSYAVSLDTAVREEIPSLVWRDVLGGELYGSAVQRADEQRRKLRL